MNTTYYFWLAGFVSLGGAAVAAHLLKSPQRMHVTHVYLLFAFIFVVIFGYRSFELRKDSNLAVTQAEGATLKLKFTTALVASSRTFSMDQKHKDDLDKNVKSSLQSALDELEKSKQKVTNQKPDLELDTKIVIIKAEQKMPVKADIDKIASIDSDRAKLLRAVLEEKSVSKKDASTLKSLIESKIPQGWFSEVFDLEWTKALGNKKKHEEKLESFYNHYFWYLIRLLLFFAFMALMTIVGIVTIGCQLFLLGRNSSRENDKINDNVTWSWQALAATLLTWLAITFLSSPLMKNLSTSASQSEMPALTLALSTMGLYLAQNLPALALVYFLAIKPGGMKLGTPLFNQTFALQWKTQKRGPIGLLFMGILAWASCFPLIILCAFVASNFGSQMSSNPLISEVVSSVKDMNPLAILAFIVTLGIMPALLEEFLFRGFVYTSLRKYTGAFLALILSAGIFSLVHMDQGSMLQLFALGFVFAYVFEKNHSLIPSMVAHCLWNLTTFAIILLLYA